MPHLLLVSLGPIQDFISSARRCQDLWFGSWLLSELSRVTAEAMGGSGTVIFPVTVDVAGGDRPGVANKILVRLADGVSPRAAAEEARRVQQARLREIAGAAWAGLPDDAFEGEAARAQLEDLMEFLWVSVPEEPGERGYLTARTAAEARLAALKNSRSWRQPTWHSSAGVGVPKSSLDGDRESVIHERVYDWHAERRRRTFGIKGKERLCGVGLLKRLGADLEDGRDVVRSRPSFHSTSHVAMLPVMERIASAPEGAAEARKYLGTLVDLGLDTARFCLRGGGSAPTLLGHDGVLLLESRLRDHFEECDVDPGRVDGVVAEASRALRTLLRTVGLSGDPCPYYAFLLADGDQMGRAIDRMDELEDHQALGGALDRFSSGCAAIVDAHHGSLVFAGGDDVLALLPLHRAVACSRALAQAFEQAVQPIVDERWRPRRAGDAKPITTLSVGLAVSHCREPMGEARRLAKLAEQEAKVKHNALSIVVSKRGAGELVVSGRWDAASPLDERLAAWLEILDDGELSSKTAHDLERLASHYDGVSADQQLGRAEEIRSLTRQVLRRKRGRGGAVSASSEAVKTLLAPLGNRAPLSLELRAMSAELQVATLILRAQRNATDAPPTLGAAAGEIA